MTLLTRLDRAAVLEIILWMIVVMAVLFTAAALGVDRIWLYVVMGIVHVAGGVWLANIFTRLKKRQSDT